MELKELLKKVAERLTEMNFPEVAKNVVHAVNEAELISYIRVHVFHDDEKTEEFVKKIKGPDLKLNLERKELSERAVVDTIRTSLSVHFEKEKTNFKFQKDRISPEEDLVFELHNSQNQTTTYRVLVIKCS